MKAVILIGGQGTRLRPLTCTIPKAMVPVLNRPFLAHLLLYLKKHGVDEAILAMGYLPDAIQKGLGDGSSLGVRITYVVEKSPLGTAGAVKNADTFLDDTFLVFNGDILTDIDLTEMIKRHHEAKPKASIALTPVEDPTAFGVVETDNKGRVRRFVEKPTRDQVNTNMINAGIYILEPEVLSLIPANTPFMFEHHLFPALLSRGDAMIAYPSHAYWIDIGTPEKYLKAHHDLLRKQEPEVQTEDGTIVHPSARISGPVILGAGCTIAEGVTITGPTILGPDCRIGKRAVIDGAVVWGGAIAGEGAVIRRCLVGSGDCLDKGSEITESCVLGDNVTVTRGTRLPPGTKVWPNTRVTPADLPLKSRE